MFLLHREQDFCNFCCKPSKIKFCIEGVSVGEIYNTLLDSNEGDLSPHTSQTIYFSKTNENKMSDKEAPVGEVVELDMVGLSMRCNYSPMISILADSKISPYISYIRNVKNYQIWESVSKIYSIIMNRVYSQWIFHSPHFIVIALFLILSCFENNDRCVYNIDKFTLW